MATFADLHTEVLLHITGFLSPQDYSSLACTARGYAVTLGDYQQYCLLKHQAIFSASLYAASPRDSMMFLSTQPQDEIVKLAIDHHDMQLWMYAVATFGLTYDTPCDDSTCGELAMMYGKPDMLLAVWDASKSVDIEYNKYRASICPTLLARAPNTLVYSFHRALLTDDVNSPALLAYIHSIHDSFTDILTTAVHADAPRIALLICRTLRCGFTVTMYILAVRRRCTKILPVMTNLRGDVTNVLYQYLQRGISDRFRYSSYYMSRVVALVKRYPMADFLAYYQKYTHIDRIVQHMKVLLRHLTLTIEDYGAMLCLYYSFSIFPWCKTVDLFPRELDDNEYIQLKLNELADNKRADIVQRAYALARLHKSFFVTNHPIKASPHMQVIDDMLHNGQYYIIIARGGTNLVVAPHTAVPLYALTHVTVVGEAVATRL